MVQNTINENQIVRKMGKIERGRKKRGTKEQIYNSSVYKTFELDHSSKTER